MAETTAMEYLSSPKSEGLITALVAELGFKPIKGRLPSGLKADILREFVGLVQKDSTFAASFADSVKARQAARPKGASPRIARTPESVLRAVADGHLDAATLLKELNRLKGRK